jgi:hypothetical protein
LAQEAPALALLAPQITVDERAPPSAPRTVRFTITADVNVRCLELWHESGPALATVSVNQRATRRFVRFSPELDARLLRLLTGDRNRTGWHLRHCGAQGAPVAIELTIDGGTPAVLHLVEERYGLPDQPPLAPRDASSGPLQASDVTLSARQLVL